MIVTPNAGGARPLDVNSSEGLLALANSHGGAVAQAANELAYPTTSILSTVGNGFKTAFKGFIDVLSMPNQIVAGTISSEYTIGEAMEKNIATSDVIFGERDPHATTMQKTGSFLTRTAVDILLDPLTYVTFGAGSGAILGARGATKIALGEKAAMEIGKEAAATAVVSKAGQNVYSTFRKVEAQMKGLTKVDELSGNAKMAREIANQTGLDIKDAYDFTKGELKEVLEHTLDAPLDIDFAKKAMTRLMESHPQLASTLLDKGGLKFFGQSVLSGQRINATMKMIPGMTLMDKITAPARNSVEALFNPELVKVEGNWTRIPEEATWLTQSAKDLAESMKDSRISHLGDIVKANKLNTTEAKLLFASIEARKIPADERLANAYKQLMGFNKEEFTSLRNAGVPITFLDKHVPHMLVKGSAKVMGFSTPPSQKVGAALERTMKDTIYNADTQQLEAIEGLVVSGDLKAANKMLSELKNEGFDIFDDNIITALARRTADNSRVVATRNFLDALPGHFAVTADQAPPGWVGLNLGQFKKEEEFLTKIGKASDTLRFHPAIAQRVENFLGSVINDEASNDALKAYDSLQNLWKASVTSIFPAFHGRNAISNVFMGFNDLGRESFNPKMHAISGQIVGLDRKLNGLKMEAMKPNPRAGVQDEINEILQKNVFTDATGNAWTYGELHRVMKNNGIAFNRNIVGSLDVTKGTDSIVADLFPVSPKDVKAFVNKNVTGDMGQNFVGFRAGRAVGNAIEEQARTMSFITNLRNTGDVQMAAVRTKQFLFDYRNLTAFEKTFMRRLMPFYTFTRKNLESQARTIMSAPGYTAAQATAITNLGDAIAGDKLTPEEEAALPAWIKSGIAILRKKEGSVATMYGALGTPFEAAFSSVQPNNVLGSLSPLLRVPIESASGYNFFQGKPISEVTNATAFKNAPGPIKKLIGYTEVKAKRKDGTSYTLYMSLRPEMMHLVLNLPPTSRVLTAMKQMENADIDTSDKILQQTLGLRPYSFDLEQEAQKRENELKAKLQNVLTTAGITAQFTRTYIPKDK